VLRKLLFPGNPPRERAPYVPPPPPPPPAAAAAAAAGDVGLNRAGARTRRAGGKSAVGTVTAVHSKKEFDALLVSTRSKQLVVVDFFATWCGPCQQIAPKFEAMAAAMPQAKFVKVDVDQCKDLSQQYGVQSMPTFKLIRGGKVVDEMKGADDGALKEKVEALAGKADRWAAAGGGRLCRSPADRRAASGAGRAGEAEFAGRVDWRRHARPSPAVKEGAAASGDLPA